MRAPPSWQGAWVNQSKIYHSLVGATSRHQREFLRGIFWVDRRFKHLFARLWLNTSKQIVHRGDDWDRLWSWSSGHAMGIFQRLTTQVLIQPRFEPKRFGRESISLPLYHQELKLAECSEQAVFVKKLILQGWRDFCIINWQNIHRTSTFNKSLFGCTIAHQFNWQKEVVDINLMFCTPARRFFPVTNHLTGRRLVASLP